MDRLIPFTADVYAGMFARYNAETWPALVLALLLGAVALICVRRGEPRAGRILAFTLATYWVWTGWAFFIQTYAGLNWAAVPFGALFIAQGVLTALWGGVLGRFETAAGRTRSVEIGTALLFAALLGHPVLTYAFGHPIDTAHGFGTAPATVALIAVAALYLIYGRAVLWLALWPVLWAAWDLASAWTMGLWRDVPLPALTLFFAAWLAAQRLRR
jgi:hypothetical protein